MIPDLLELYDVLSLKKRLQPLFYENVLIILTLNSKKVNII